MSVNDIKKNIKPYFPYFVLLPNKIPNYIVFTKHFQNINVCTFKLNYDLTMLYL